MRNSKFGCAPTSAEVFQSPLRGNEVAQLEHHIDQKNITSFQSPYEEMRLRNPCHSLPPFYHGFSGLKSPRLLRKIFCGIRCVQTVNAPPRKSPFRWSIYRVFSGFSRIWFTLLVSFPEMPVFGGPKSRGIAP